MVRGGPYQTDEDATKNKTKLLADLKKTVPNEEELALVEGVLNELFPLFQSQRPPKATAPPEKRFDRQKQQADQ